jgi:hypothetical protein
MSDTRDFWLFGLSGTAFLLSSGFTVLGYNTYNFLINTPHISLQELFEAKDKYLYRQVFVYGQATASESIKVATRQAVTSVNYSDVIYRDFSETLMNQDDFIIHRSGSTTTCNFTLRDLDNRQIEVRPTSDTEFTGLQVYQASGYFELSWTQALESMLGFFAWAVYKALNFRVVSRYE